MPLAVAVEVEAEQVFMCGSEPEPIDGDQV